MEGVSRASRVYFAAVGLLALWVGFWGFFVPARVDVALPFLVPPLHARFIGVMYLSGLTLQIAGMTARRWAKIGVVPIVTAVWTGGLFLVSLLHLDVFDFGAARVVIWFAAYLVYPLVALWLLWSHRAATGVSLPGASLPGWARAYLVVQGAVATILGFALLIATDALVRAWPWAITPLLAQIYFAPLLAYGLASFYLARKRTWPDIRVGVTAMLTFAGGVLVASLLHRGLFSLNQRSDLVWFVGFSVATAALAVLTAGSVRGSPREAAA